MNTVMEKINESLKRKRDELRKRRLAFRKHADNAAA
jgi:hypothetical protein